MLQNMLFSDAGHVSVFLIVWTLVKMPTTTVQIVTPTSEHIKADNDYVHKIILN